MTAGFGREAGGAGPAAAWADDQDEETAEVAAGGTRLWEDRQGDADGRCNSGTTRSSDRKSNQALGVLQLCQPGSFALLLPRHRVCLA